MGRSTLWTAAGVSALVVVAALVARVWLAAGEVPPDQPPDLVVVTWDTTRADHIGAYGYFRDTTPNLDAIAAEGVVFEHHVVPQSTTLPSHLSLFTGVHPEEHGVISNANAGDRWLIPEDLSTLAMHLSAHGYRTAAFVSATPLKRSSGLDRGFDVYDQPEDKTREGAQTTDRALAWLEDQPAAGPPRLLWVHVFDPHMPYRVSEEFRPDGHEAERDAWLEARGIRVNRRARRRVDQYDGEIRYVDAQLGRLIAALEREPARQRVLVVAGDHGEVLGEHGYFTHGRVWRGELEAPLVVKAPGLAPRRVSDVVSTVDVLPTVLGVADFPAEQALLAQVSGRDALREAPRPVVSRSSLRQSRLTNHPRLAIPPRFALTTEDWTYVRDTEGRQYLFDRASDPFEMTNVAFDEPDVAASLRGELQTLLDTYAARADELGAGVTVEGDELERAELEALGYVE